ncbi:MAG: hypothetical protein U0795_02920 [Pirellulales bacterium]
MSAETVHLIRRSDEAIIEAHLVDGLKPSDLQLVEREWGPVRSQFAQHLLSRGIERRRWPESLHWDWGKKAPELKLLEASGFGVVYGDRWQGVMLTKTVSHAARLAVQRGKPLVYVDFLEAAPWNWNVVALERQGELRGVGSLLFRKAVVQSKEEGFRGRVGLHGLPQAHGFS